MVINEIRGSCAEKTGDFESAGNEAGKAGCGVTWRIFLVVSVFVSFVNNDKTEVV